MISLDAVALYPSLKAEETADICASLYAFLTEGSECVPPDCLPSRKYSSGPTPTITTLEILGPLMRNKEKSKFNPPKRDPTVREKKTILFHILKTAVWTVMKHHT